ncbi:hypothetical protein LPICM17_130027 [Lactococcus piscium]|uniref:Uncharacterized protein n=1 Tax=Pseudolactococcus carnosus TaxID=2749961 RepID=A0ABT0ASD2_9LACT|nr:hypothetical protein [Lactococcus carnosus]MCJ1989512.1 hypothetical protein [Lactococcus carnosus]MCJ2002354.1 hypothetical protein [Lactococcus carnosus]SCA91396.1 hypothetical protein LP2241_20166 [Lactococcus piscium]SOB46963.1 hypothetical protein LPICM17_130027 [Lactococcus piscium]
MKTSQKVGIAYTLVNNMLEKNEKWINLEKSNYVGSVFNSTNTGEYPYDNIFVHATSKNKILCIGKYESRYYTDEDKFYSDYYYFFSFGSVEGDKITSLETVTETDFGGNVKLEKLYSKASLSNMDIDFDDIENSFF